MVHFLKAALVQGSDSDRRGQPAYIETPEGMTSEKGCNQKKLNAYPPLAVADQANAG